MYNGLDVRTTSSVSRSNRNIVRDKDGAYCASRRKKLEWIQLLVVDDVDMVLRAVPPLLVVVVLEGIMVVVEGDTSKAVV